MTLPTASAPAVSAPENPCLECAYFDGVEAQYPADTNPTIARHLVRWRQRHADDGECTNPEADPDE
ncbi:MULTISPECIES: hypothetical protein [Kitasatospora]|uniref:Uncharacterized protein n=1 Tax=Kitasatospora setae (strain ATCC 33774 / DSM 43861 / JCM 3304 / KCC A-0304 / NBRC 14216 / KM-6054) TaxID=452652 RepID=E4NF17_KITSK|nr:MULTISPECIES: hypothetical protein [Kitasatospora]BAJ30097.1 hypothetical protein KSE_43130 [Kitasatospora setae KM-6054]